MKRLRLLLGFALASALLCAGLLGLLLSVLRPERAAPEIGGPRREAVRTVRTVAPYDDGCRVLVRVEGPEGSVPAAEVVVESGRAPHVRRWALPATPIDAEGRATIAVPCREGANVRAAADGFVPQEAWLPASDERVRAATLVLAEGVRVYGTVTDQEGAPVPDATLMTRGSRTTSGPDGGYELWADPKWNGISVEAFGHAHVDERWVPEGRVFPPDGVRVDITLERLLGLRVWCEGLPDDTCGDMPVQCTTPYALVGTPCQHDDETGEVRCACPAGDEVAVRGGGRAVLVDGDAEEAWLDFRDTGTIVGKVTVDGAAPAWCSVMAFRVPDALEDLPRGGVAGRTGGCDAEGGFRVEGLVPGDWELSVRARAHHVDATERRTLVPRAVQAGAVVDVGAVALPGGGVVEGVVIDGVTGAPVSKGGILAVRRGAGGERRTFTGGEADADGRFRIEGLPAGTWTVAHVLSPQEYVTVTVREGATTGGVELVTSDATALAENGFSLAEEDGALVVADVEPGSPAYDAGLEPDEEVVGVLVAGFDIAGLAGGRGAELARVVLGHYDGPGVTLVVRNPDGEEEEVPLDW